MAKKTGTDVIEINDIAEIGSDIIATAYSDGVAGHVLSAISDLIKRDVREYDMAVKKDRDECASLAHKITRSRTLLEKAGADQVRTFKESIDKQVKLVNSVKAIFTETLNAARDNVREPLTNWENERKGFEATVASVVALGTGNLGAMASQDIEKRIERLAGLKAMAEDFPKDMLHEMLAACSLAAETLGGALAITKQREIDAAELRELRAAQAMQQSEAAPAERGPHDPDKAWIDESAAIDQTAFANVAPATGIPGNINLRKGQVHSAIVLAMVSKCGVSEDIAKHIVAETVRGNIAHLTINY